MFWSAITQGSAVRERAAAAVGLLLESVDALGAHESWRLVAVG